MGKFSKRLIQGIERRDSIGNPSKWLTMAFGGQVDTAAGIRISESVALREATVFSCVRLISGILSSLPLPVFARTADGGKTRVPTHPVYRVLDKAANPRMTAMEFRELAVEQLLLYGNAYAFIDRDNAGRVKALWPLLADRTRPQLNAAGELVYLSRIKNDPNGVSPNDGAQIELLAEDVLHIKGLSQDGLKGLSPVVTLRENIATALALQEFGGRFFSNGAIPGLVLKSAGNLSPEQKTMLRTMLEESHGSLINAHRSMVLEAGLSVEKISVDANSAQWIESKKFSRSEIAAAFNVPLFLLGEVEKGASFASVEQQMVAFHTLCIGPLARRIEQAVNQKLFLESEQDVFFCEHLPGALLKGDAKTRFEAYHLARQDGWMSVNDIRDAENMNRVDGGDVYLQPLNMIPVGTDPSTPDEAPSPNDPGTASDVAFSRRKLMQAQTPVLEAELGRVIKRERADLTKAGEQRVSDPSWLSSFYKEHGGYIARQTLPALRSYAAHIRADIERELGRPVPGSLETFTVKLAGSLASRHVDESLRILRGDQFAIALEQACGFASRRTDRIAANEAAKAGNAFATALYRAAGVETVISGDDDCNRRAQGVHPPLKDGCTCVVISAGRANRSDAPQASDLTQALNVALASAERPINVNITTPPVSVTTPPITVDANVNLPPENATEVVYWKQGEFKGAVRGSRPVDPEKLGS